MVIGERIEELLQAKGWSQAELARRIGVKSTSIWKLVSGSTQNTRFIHQIARELETTPEYLQGETDDRSLSALAESQRSFRHTEPSRDADLVEIAQVDIRYGLGGSFLDNSEFAEPRTFSRAWLRNFTSSAPEHLFWAIGDGDSMEPTIRSGEVILIDRSQDTPRLGDGIWAVAIGEIGMVKRLHFPGPGRVELISDNGLVPPIVPGQDELQIIGRVVAVVRKL